MYRVGTHLFAKNFVCITCAKRYYEKIKDKQLTYLIDVSKNTILLNTYGWVNG